MISLFDATVRAAIAFAQGNLTTAAEFLKLTRLELDEHMADKPALLQFVVDFREELIDDAQVVLSEAIDHELPWAIKYTLKTLGAGRGYRHEKPKKESANKKLPIDESGAEGVENKESGIEGADGIANGESETGKERIAVPGARLPTPDCRLPSQIGQEQILKTAKALRQAKGHLTDAAMALQTTRAELKKVIADCPHLQLTLMDVRESLVDNAETALRRAVRTNKPWAVFFSLSTLARDRGYGLGPRSARQLNPAAFQNFSIPEGTRPDPMPLPQDSTASPAQECKDGKAAGLPTPADPENDLGNQPSSAGQFADPHSMPKREPLLPLGPLDGRSKKEKMQDDVFGANARRESTAKLPITAAPAPVARNAQCPCGSGRKYKRCCGMDR